MKPVNYQVLSSSVHGVQPDFGFHSLSGASKVRFPERTGLDSPETSVFNKSTTDLKQTHYTCFYCNTVFLREVQLFEHMKQHTKHFPYVCPYCAQGYVKRLCLVNHIERFHSNDIIQGSAKNGRPKVIQDSVRGAIRNTPTSDPSPVRPYVHVKAPTQAKPAVRVEREQQVGKQSASNSSNTSNGNAEHFPPFNGHMQHNRALTVSLPDEVNIPAGCMVELVEVKTVNGTKELKLRVVSQQESKSAVKEKRNTAYQNTALGKPLSSTLKHPIKVPPTTMGACTVNRKRCEINTPNVEQPPAVSSLFRNPVNVNKRALKRQSQEIINLESNIPSKVPKVIVSSNVSPVREGPIKITIPLNHKAPPPTVSGPRVTTARTGICQKIVGEGTIEILEDSKIVPQQRKSDAKNNNTIQAAPLAMTFEPGGSTLNSKAITNSVREALALSFISRPPIQRSSPSARPQAASPNKDSDVSQVFSPNKTMSIKTPVDSISNHTTLKMSPKSRSREAPTKKVQAQSFPVISSVFSLSQQPENPQGAIKPVLMALRGVVLDKLKSGSTHQTEEPNKGPMLGNTAWVETKTESFTHEIVTTNQTHETIKEEQDLQHGTIQVKEEKDNPPPIQIKDGDKSCPSANRKLPRFKVTITQKPSQEGAPASMQTSKQLLKNERDISKFLTISLERMVEPQQGGAKQQMSGAHVGTRGHGYVMPLNMNQLIKQPGPYQPVVLLNHPKPRLCGGHKSMADSCSSNAATLQEIPECQILKMRLSKVMGQKYEVMGYTVKVSQ